MVYSIIKLFENFVDINSMLDHDNKRIFSIKSENSQIEIIIPKEIINILGKEMSEYPEDSYKLGYITNDDLWYIFKNDQFFYSNKKIDIKYDFNRYTALIKSAPNTIITKKEHISN